MMGAHPASSWPLVSGFSQQVGIQVSSQRLSPRSHSALFGVQTSVSSSGFQAAALCVSELASLLRCESCLSSLVHLLAWTPGQSQLM